MYRFINDPGHGWLAVPLIEVKAFPDIEISSCSYVDNRNGYAYLEEDMDASTFINAKMAADQYEGTIQDWFAENVSESYVERTHIRNLPRY